MTHEAIEQLDSVGVVYVSEEEPEYRLVRRGRGFSYHDLDGSLVDEETKSWIEDVVIPPAWTDVWGLLPHAAAAQEATASSR